MEANPPPEMLTAVRRKPDARSGAALIMTLAAVALMTGLILAFFSRAMLNKQISTAGVGQSRAENIAETALLILTGDLREEIAAGSADPDNDGTPGTTIDGVTLYRPNNPDAQLPQITGITGDFPNLIKRSASAVPFWDQDPIEAAEDGPLRAINSAANTASRNRSGISANRWNKPKLLDSSPSDDIPDWCLVLRSGVLNGTAPTLANLSNHDPDNQDFAVGRFAYMIYNTGNLLDINIAGSTLPAADTRRKGRLFTADLTGFPGISDPTSLLNWRNPSPSLARLINPANAFLDLWQNLEPGSKTFVRRQDLLHYASTHPSVLTDEALQYLGTFSRALNAPSWSPPADASDLGGNNGTGNIFAYKTNAELPASINRNLSQVRVQTPFTRPDGSQALAGEPLLQQRFPLSRLALATDSATAASGSDLETFFGLTRADSSPNTPWIYRNGAASILTLDQVAQAGREPDFFELLKASILNGSLGKYSNTNYSLITKTFDENKDAQIIQIGANLVDQYDEDHHPTLIRFSTLDTVYGVENLPRLDHIYLTVFRPNRGNPEYPNLEGWVQFGLWNPHGNASDFTTSAKFRIIATDGRIYLEASNGTNFVSAQQNLAGRYLEFTATGTTFAEPRLLIPNTTMTGGASFTGVPIDNTNDSNAYFGTSSQPSYATTTSVSNSSPCYLVGFHMGTLVNTVTGNPVKDRNITSVPTDPASLQYYHPRAALGAGGRYPSFELQYQDSSGNWRTYESVQVNGVYLDHWYQYGFRSCTTWVNGRYTLSSGWGPDGNGSGPLIGTGVAYGKTALSSMDPRTKRAGMVRLIGFNNEIIVANGTIRPNSWTNRFDSDFLANGAFPTNPAGITMWRWWTGNNKFQPAQLSNNIATQSSHVIDLDGIIRRADGDESRQVSPLWQTGNIRAMRPYLLNRPFRSVAEMGHTMRGDPWKSLNFFSADSADAALLDVFSIDDSPLVAGRVSLNTPHAPVLEAILRGTLKAEDGTASPPVLSNAEATKVAEAILQEQGSSPFQNVSELATRVGNQLADQLDPVANANSDGYIKTRRESALRALAGVAETRTWNLMIDVIAQAGRYPTNARNLDDFLVEGERRYWLHLALDRHTGEVISSQLEPVYE